MVTVEKIKVFLALESSLNIQMMSNSLGSDEAIRVVDGSSDLFSLENKISFCKPDIVVLDTDISRLSIVDVVKKILFHNNVPILLLTPPSEKGVSNAFELLQIGAVDFIVKCSSSIVGISPDLSKTLVRKIKALYNVKQDSLHFTMNKLSKTNNHFIEKNDMKLVLVGASTYGTEILIKFLSIFPKNFVPIVAVIDLPVSFFRAFVNRLKRVCNLEVQEIRHNEVLLPGVIYLSSPGVHNRLKKDSDGNISAFLKDGEIVAEHKPSIDIMFDSVSKFCGSDVIAVLFSGIGLDGINGLRALKEVGARTFLQDVGSSIVSETAQVGLNVKAATRYVAMEDMGLEVIRCFG